jgi:hypothetical protein
MVLVGRRTVLYVLSQYLGSSSSVGGSTSWLATRCGGGPMEGTG